MEAANWSICRDSHGKVSPACKWIGRTNYRSDCIENSHFLFRNRRYGFQTCDQVGGTFEGKDDAYHRRFKASEFTRSKYYDASDTVLLVVATVARERFHGMACAS